MTELAVWAEQPNQKSVKPKELYGDAIVRVLGACEDDVGRGVSGDTGECGRDVG